MCRLNYDPEARGIDPVMTRGVQICIPAQVLTLVPRTAEAATRHESSRF